MEPEWIMLESSLTGMGVEAREQPRHSRRKMQQTTVGGCKHTDGNLEDGECLLKSLSG